MLCSILELTPSDALLIELCGYNGHIHLSPYTRHADHEMAWMARYETNRHFASRRSSGTLPQRRRIFESYIMSRRRPRNPYTAVLPVVDNDSSTISRSEPSNTWATCSGNNRYREVHTKHSRVPTTPDKVSSRGDLKRRRQTPTTAKDGESFIMCARW